MKRIIRNKDTSPIAMQLKNCYNAPSKWQANHHLNDVTSNRGRLQRMILLCPKQRGTATRVATSSEASEKGKGTACSFLELADANSARGWSYWSRAGEDRRRQEKRTRTGARACVQFGCRRRACVPATSRDSGVDRTNAATFRAVRVFKRLAVWSLSATRNARTRRKDGRTTRVLPRDATLSLLYHATCHSPRAECAPGSRGPWSKRRLSTCARVRARAVSRPALADGLTGVRRRRNSRSDSDENAIANVYAAPSPARATDRPYERPTDQPDRTRERRLRLHSKRRTVAGVEGEGGGGSDPRRWRGHSVPSAPSAVAPGEAARRESPAGIAAVSCVARQMAPPHGRAARCGTVRAVVCCYAILSSVSRHVCIYKFRCISDNARCYRERPSGIEAYL